MPKSKVVMPVARSIAGASKLMSALEAPKMESSGSTSCAITMLILPAW